MIIRNAIINPENLIHEENSLLDRWAQTVPGFIRDGVVDARKYSNAPVKVLVVLKEVNGGSDWDLRDFLRNGGRSQTWNVVARWIEGIFNIERDFSWSELEADNENRRSRVLQHICAINVKKTSGTAVADNKTILEAARRDQKFLAEQIALYCPDLVICGGTVTPYIKATNAKPNWKMTTRGIWYYIEESGTIVVSYSHPEARTKECLLHYGLTDAVREIMAGAT